MNFKTTNILTSLIAKYALLFCVLTSVNATAQGLPDLSDSASSVMSRAQERMVGQQIMLSVRSRTPFSQDTLLLNYLSSLTNHLSEFSEVSDIKIGLAIEPSINAFAVPGGYITVNTGLIANTREENELAGVLAHEIGHHSQRHIVRSIERKKQLSMPAAIATIGGLLIGGQIGTAAVLSTQAALGSDQLTYSRTFEREADATGMKILAAAGIPPEAMAHFFEQLEKQSRLLGGNIPDFLRTHPVSSTRIADSLSRAQKMQVADNKGDTISTLLAYPQAKARVIALYGRPIDTIIRQFQQTPSSESSQEILSRLYGLHLAHRRKGEFDQAQTQLSKLIQRQPNSLLYQIAQANLSRLKNDTNSALNLFERLYAEHKHVDAITKGYAQTLVLGKNYQRAISILRKVLRKKPDQLWASTLLARAYGDNKQSLNALLTKAENYYTSGQYTRAAKLIEQGIAQLHDDQSDYLSSRANDLLKQAKTAKKRLDEFKL